MYQKLLSPRLFRKTGTRQQRPPAQLRLEEDVMSSSQQKSVIFIYIIKNLRQKLLNF